MKIEMEKHDVEKITDYLLWLKEFYSDQLVEARVMPYDDYERRVSKTINELQRLNLILLRQLLERN